MYNVNIFFTGGQHPLYINKIKLQDVEYIKTGMMEGKMICLSIDQGTEPTIIFYINGSLVSALNVYEERKQL